MSSLDLLRRITWKFPVNLFQEDVHKRLKWIYLGSLMTLHHEVPVEPRYPEEKKSEERSLCTPHHI
jgi:hypothetical protein